MDSGKHSAFSDFTQISLKAKWVKMDNCQSFNQKVACPLYSPQPA